jgi:FAD/FMN-containing dehydrogenase
MMEDRATLLARLTAAVGPRHVLTDDADTAPWLTDWRGRFRGRALAVVRPASTAEAAAVVRACAEAGTPVVPQGGNTGLCGGATPDASGTAVVVALTRMHAIRGLDAANATITVEAGATLAAVHDAATAAGFRFPLSLASEGSCTVGGTLSTNAGGTAVLRYGNMRNLVLGLEVVLADGRVLPALRGLRKDNTGYDLKQLFVGAEGTLGLITAATLALFPLPSAQVTAFAAVDSPRQAVDLLGLMQRALSDRLTGFEVIGAEALALCRAHFPALPDPLPGHRWYVLIQADDSAPGSALAAAVEAGLGAALEAGVVADALVAGSGAQAQALWTLRENISDAQKTEGPNIKHDVSLPVSAIPEFLDAARVALDAALPGVRYIVFGHLGDGNLHYNLSPPRGVAHHDFLAHGDAANRIVHDLVAARGGSFSAEHGIGQLKRAELERYKSPVELETMRRIKAALDPAGVFNPGKVV